MQIEPTPEYLASQGLSPTFSARFWAKVNKDGPIPAHMPHLGKCWVWTAFTNKGYGTIVKWKHGEAPMRAHIGSWILHIGPVPKHIYVLHRCDNPSCVNPAHLFLGSNSDNVRDMVIKGRQTRGDKHHLSKLNSSQVLKIRTIWSRKNRPMQSELADLFGVKEDTIWQVVNRRTWKHI
jgi:hypothetical protein